jgi:Flp pilus assembly protein TadG
MIEMAMMMPIVVTLSLGVIELSYAMLDQHVVTKLTREGSNLISRDTTLGDASTALRNMASAPVNFGSRSTMILSVLKNVATIGAANFGKTVLYQRYQFGALSETSKLQTAGTASFGPAPDYIATNSDNNTSLRVTNLPANMLATGDMLYVTEIYSTHTLFTPLNRFGIVVPNTLYSIAYF